MRRQRSRRTCSGSTCRRCSPSCAPRSAVSAYAAAQGAEPDVAPTGNTTRIGLVQTGRLGKSGEVVVVAPGIARESVVLARDDTLVGQPVATAFPSVARLIAERRWRDQAAAAPRAR